MLYYESTSWRSLQIAILNDCSMSFEEKARLFYDIRGQQAGLYVLRCIRPMNKRAEHEQDIVQYDLNGLPKL